MCALSGMAYGHATSPEGRGKWVVQSPGLFGKRISGKGKSLAGSVFLWKIQDSTILSLTSSEPEAWLNRFSRCSTVRFFFSSPDTSTRT